jgi:electron transfer flavoprotein alpha subunit
MSILVVLEGDRAISRETLAAALTLGAPVSAVAIGEAPSQVPEGLAALHLIQQPLLAAYSADGYTAALAQFIAAQQPNLVLFPHTYQVRDYAPKLATRLGKPLVSDVVRLRADNGAFVLTRQMFQGKLNADYRASGPGPHFASIQAGAYRADALALTTATAQAFSPNLDSAAIRTTAEEPFRESARAVDLGAAEVIVSVGRGIKEKENIAIVEELAQALNAELAASRPICDNGWLPMERQVGSSGQTVAPKLYLAIGISGAIQHLVGMKGAKTVAAINRDPDAPIFEIADYGIVGDLFEIVPALTEEVRKLR